jgi:HK97 family phage major capsid protein
MADLTPTAGMREEAQRYRDWKAEGRSGGTAVAARRATQILSGDSLSEDTVITMAAWFARHEVDKRGQGFSPGEEGYPSPGRVAWAAWGGDPGQTWATARADTIKAAQEAARTAAMETTDERPYPNEHAARLVSPDGFDRFRRETGAGGEGVDFIYGIKAGEPVKLQAIRFDAARFTAAQARSWLAEHDYQAILFEEATGEKAQEGEQEKRGLTADMTAQQALLHEALEEIAEETGEFSQATAHYMPESPFADKGMVCSNCAFYKGPAACEIVEGSIAPGALCKFWIIPDSLLAPEARSTAPAAEEAAAPVEPAAPVVLASGGSRAAAVAQLRTLTGAALRSRLGDDLVRTRELPTSAAPVPDGDLLRFDFSSEAPVDRWFGREVLSHAPGAADLSRLNNGAPFLWNHDRDKVLGRVMGAEIGANRRGSVTTKWSRNTTAQEKRQDVEDEILGKVSFAYEIREAVDMGTDGVLITKWQPLEVSLVSIPADDTVGLKSYGDSSSQSVAASVATVAKTTTEPIPSHSVAMTVTAPPEDAIRAAQDAETERITIIQAMCKTHGMPESLANELVSNRRSVADAQAVVLEKLGKVSRELQPGGLHVESQAMIGMGSKDLQRYSLVKLLRTLADPSNAAYREAAAFEIELSRAAEAKEGRSANGLLVPFDWMVAKRDQTVGSFGKGGALVGTELLAGSFIDLLRNQSALLQSGITTLTGLTGNVDIPRKTAASQHYWVGEDVDVTASDATFGLISSTPKTIGVRVPVSRRALIQTTPDIDTLVRADMAESLALGVDASGLYGTGSNGQPLGLAFVIGVAPVTLGGGTSQAYPSNLGGGTHDSGDWNDYIDLQAACMAANVNTATSRYIMNAITMAGGMKTLRASAAGANFIVSDDGTISRYPVLMSNQVQQNDVFFGEFSDLVLATWSGLDIVVDPYTQSAKGQVIYTVMQDIDWVCRRAQSFALGS